jgi:mannan endo-1,4-beta-mannosidase
MGKRGRWILVMLILAGITGVVGFEKVREALISTKAAATLPVNKEASDGAKKLLKLLYEIKGKYTIAGQHSYLEAPNQYADRLKQITGDHPGLKGYEMGGVEAQSESQLEQERDGMVKSAIQWHEAGGIVAMTYHVRLPGQCYCWDQVNNGGITEQQFQEIITPGTDSYKQHLADLDSAASALKKLRDAGVPVLWRPYHEMNGGWFWWGRQPEFTKLWDIMFERFTEVHQLNNLLWVWSPNAPDDWSDPFEAYYVGAGKADVLAVDIYYNRYEQVHHDQLTALAKDKPIAIGENGQLPAPALLNNEQKNYVWFMTWGKELEGANSNQVIQTLYEQEHILTYSKLRLMEKVVR